METEWSQNSLIANLWLLRLMLETDHLNTLNVVATHAAAPIYEEQQFSGSFVQLLWFTQQVRAEVEHQHWTVQNVLVVPLPHKLKLKVKSLERQLLATFKQSEDWCA